MAAPIVNAELARQADDDGALVQRILRHDHAAFEILMRRYNAKLYRVARSILKNDADVEDVLQEAYLAAYRGLDRFQGAAQLSTWLTRIVINQALGRLRASKRDAVVVGFSAVEETAECLSIPAATVRSRLHRARAQLRESLALELDSSTEGVFPFGGTRCDRIVSPVLGPLQSLTGLPAGLPEALADFK